MARLFVTGDTHQYVDIEKLSASAFKTGKILTKEDIVVIMGDAGFVWNYGPDAMGAEKWWREWISNKPWTTFCVLGNHEAYSYIENFPIVDFHGALAYKITDSLYYAITGNIYDFCSKKCLVINGADSHDKEWRTPHVSWWEQEQITEEDIEVAKANLQKYNNTVDFVFSHTGGVDTCNFLGYKPTISDTRLQKILDATVYSHAYCGHYHCDKIINTKQRIIYDDIIMIAIDKEELL